MAQEEVKENENSKKPNKSIGSLIKRLQFKVDAFQRKHSYIGFPYAVQKKYGEDETGYEAALVTYYGFMSLFPLLIVALSIAQLLHNPSLKHKLIVSLNKNFPIVGTQLQNNLHATKKAGIALVVSIVLTLYGSRGVANALQRAQNHLWQVPKFMRGGFRSNLKSLQIVIVMGVSFVITGVLSGYATASNINVGLRIVAILVSLFISFLAVIQVYKLSIAEKHSYKELYTGSITAAIGIQVIQAIGGFLITHELKKLSTLYGTFAIVFAILFWIYLQVRIFLYGTEINTVQAFRLWPRSLSEALTEADKHALKLFAGRETFKKPPKERINVRFRSKV